MVGVASAPVRSSAGKPEAAILNLVSITGSAILGCTEVERKCNRSLGPERTVVKGIFSGGSLL